MSFKLKGNNNNPLIPLILDNLMEDDRRIPNVLSTLMLNPRYKIKKK
jgi:hypothetical protein